MNNNIKEDFIMKLNIENINDKIEEAASMYYKLIKYHIKYADMINISDTYSENYSIKKALNDIYKNGRKCKIIVNENKIIAMFLYKIIEGKVDDKVCFIYGIYIEEEFRNKGIGEYIIKYLYDKYKLPIELDCYYELPSHKFYKKLNFVPVYTRYYKKDFD